MRSIIQLAHVSLDGYLDPSGKMDFITFDPEVADHTYPLMRTVGGEEPRSKLELRSSKTFRCGVVATHHVVRR